MRDVLECEALEPRRLLAVDLNVGVSTAFVADVVFPGQSFPIPVSVANYGWFTATSQDIVVGARFVPVTLRDWSYVPVLASFDAAGFVDIGSITHSGGLEAAADVSLSINATVPADIVAGLYRLVVKVDVNETIIEESEFNNEDAAMPVAVLTAAGVMRLPGSAENDVVRMTPAKLQNKPAVNFITADDVLDFRIGAMAGFSVPLGGGDDIFVIEGAFTGVTVDGGAGNDRMVGGDGPETLIGGAGKDVIDGGGGNDRLNGNGGNDKLLGGAGADRLYGYDGNDYLDGGSSGDRFDGGNGLDTMLGQSGNDRFFTTDTQIDQLFGGSGSDSAAVDADDILSSIESAVIID